MYSFLKTTIICLLVCFIIKPAHTLAQETQGQSFSSISSQNYTFSASSGSYSSIVGSGTTIPSIQADDAVSSSIPIGFNFNFGCDTYSNVTISSNGFIAFVIGAMGNNNTTVPTTEAFIAPLWDDLSGAGGTAVYNVTGSAPNRIFTMEWNNWKWNYSASASVISFQVKLYETSNTIQYIYKQEAGTINSASASIGFYNGANASYSTTAKQQWLNNTSTAPTASQTNTTTINTLPATGQIYTFTNSNTCGTFTCKGRTVLNSTGGTSSSNGLMTTITGAGNIQVLRNNLNQIYSGVLNNGTSNYYQVPGTTHGVALSIGSTVFKTGTLIPSGITDGGYLDVVSNTCQSSVQNGNNYVDTVVLKKNFGGLDYFLTIIYTYTYPRNFIGIEYKVTIPAGNTQVVRLSQGWDTYLDGGDAGPGFINGTAPYYTMGVVKSPSYEAFQYKSGQPWSGYYSAVYNALNTDAGTDNTFKNTINTSSTTDNGIGISINFGSTAGTYSSSNNLIFACNAPTTAPTLTTTTLNNVCPKTTVNLNNVVSSTAPAGTNIVWRNASNGTLVSNVTTLNINGTYYAVFQDTSSGCESPSSSNVIVTINACPRPGGVSSNLALWTKADAGVTVASGYVTSWNDQSDNTNITTQASKSTGSTITLANNTYNFNPTLNFPGTTEQELVGTTSTNEWSGSISIFAVTDIASIANPVTGIFASNTKGMVAYTDNSISADATGSLGASTPVTALNPQISFISYNSDNISGSTAFSNGLQNGSAYSGNKVATPTTSFELGGRTAGSLTNRVLNGSLSEVIVFKQDMSLTANATDRNKVTSYLGIKYGITLGNNTTPFNYLSSSGTTVWTGSSSYQNNIISIAKDNTSGLDQRISVSQSSTPDIVTISTDNNFTLANTSHAVITNNNYYLLVGNNNSATSYGAYAGGTKANGIMSRVWQAQETGIDQGTVYLKTSDASANFLVLSSDATFTDSDTWIALSSGSAAVNLANGQFFTFAVSPTPGGVGNNMMLWVKANTGVTTSGSNVTGWLDQTATNTFTVVGTPQYAASSINFNPSINLNGSSSFTGNTSLSNFTDAFSVATIQNPSGISGSGAVLGITSNNSGDYFFHTEGGTLYYGNNSNYSGNTYGNNIPWSIMNADVSATPNTSDLIRINGISYTNIPGGNPVSFTGIPTIGARGTERLINGSKIAEVILYNATKSNNNERNKIQSYLAIKYGLTLGNNSNAISYLASDGTAIWTGSTSYQNNIIGIGRDISSGLEQRISTSQSSTDIITLSTDNNFTSANTSHAAVTNNNYFLLIGNNNAATTYTAYTGGSKSANIMNRVWRVQETGTDQGNVYIQTSNATAKYLVVSSDATFTDADTWINLSSGVATVNLADGQYFTFADCPNLSPSVAGGNNLCTNNTTTLSPSTDITWVSNNASVATVTSAGVITSVGVGSTTFTYTLTSNSSCTGNSPTVTVVNKPTAPAVVRRN